MRWSVVCIVVCAAGVEGGWLDSVMKKAESKMENPHEWMEKKMEEMKEDISICKEGVCAPCKLCRGTKEGVCSKCYEKDENGKSCSDCEDIWKASEVFGEKKNEFEEKKNELEEKKNAVEEAQQKKEVAIEKMMENPHEWMEKKMEEMKEGISICKEGVCAPCKLCRGTKEGVCSKCYEKDENGKSCSDCEPVWTGGEKMQNMMQGMDQMKTAFGACNTVCAPCKKCDEDSECAPWCQKPDENGKTCMDCKPLWVAGAVMDEFMEAKEEGEGPREFMKDLFHKHMEHGGHWHKHEHEHEQDREHGPFAECWSEGGDEEWCAGKLFWFRREGKVDTMCEDEVIAKSCGCTCEKVPEFGAGRWGVREGEHDGDREHEHEGRHKWGKKEWWGKHHGERHHGGKHEHEHGKEGWEWMEYGEEMKESWRICNMGVCAPCKACRGTKAGECSKCYEKDENGESCSDCEPLWIAAEKKAEWKKEDGKNFKDDDGCWHKEDDEGKMHIYCQKEGSKEWYEKQALPAAARAPTAASLRSDKQSVKLALAKSSIAHSDSASASASAHGVSSVAIVGGVLGCLLLAAVAVVVVTRRRASGLQAQLDYEMNDVRNLATPQLGPSLAGLTAAQTEAAAKAAPINIGNPLNSAGAGSISHV